MSAKRLRRAVPLALFALWACAMPARADWAVLRNGERLHITGFERQGSLCILHLAGGEVSVPALAIVRFDPEDVFAPAVVQLEQASGPYSRLVTKVARKSGLNPNLLSSVIRAESNNQPRAVSAKGAMGLMQLMPGTARGLAVRNPFDPSENVQAGAQYLKKLMGTFGDLNLALAAYNAGPATVQLYRGIPPFPETRAYIAQVRRGMEQRSPPDSKTETVELTCSPLERQCREQAVGGVTTPGPGLP